jgi:hypothetical protein
MKTKKLKPFRNLLALAAIIPSLASLPFANAAITPPDPSNLLFSTNTDDLPETDGASTGDWANYLPAGGPALTMMGTPTVAIVDGVKWVNNQNPGDDGFDRGDFTSIATNGASIVVVYKPIRNGVRTDWNALVDLGTEGLTVGIRNDTGDIVVFRKGKRYEYGDAAAIPDGQKTVLSCIFQEDGTFMIYANGVQVVNNTTTSDPNMPLNPIIPWYGGSPQSTNWASHINVGRTNGAGWASENGLIGDVFVYTTALDDTARGALESDLATKFGITLPEIYTITTSATNGTISPAGPIQVAEGTDLTFNFLGTAGFVDVVTVDGVIQPGNPTSYTFTNVQADHTLDVTFTIEPAPANDNFAAAIDLPGDSGTQTGTHSFAATVETGEPANGTTSSVWFKWTALADGDFTVRTTGSINNLGNEWDAVVGIYTGTSVDALTQITLQDSVFDEVVTIPVTAGTTYYIQAAGFGDEAASNILLDWSFVVPDPPNPYADWALFYFIPGEPDGAMEMDPDNDGMNNLQEYAFDEDPTSGAASGHMRTSIEDDGDQKALMLTVAVADSAVFTGSPSLSATAEGVVYTLEGGNDLSGFNQVVTEVTPARSDGMAEPFEGWGYRTFRLSGPISAQPAGFLRIRTAPAP